MSRRTLPVVADDTVPDVADDTVLDAMLDDSLVKRC